MDPYIGEIRIFAGNYAPEGWMFCEGQLLQIVQYSALFSLLRTTYGGNGTTTFALPNLTGRAVVDAGTGPGLTPRTVPQTGGVATVTLNTNTMAPHTHAAMGTADSGATTPTEGSWGTVPAGRSGPTPIYASATPSVTMHAEALGNSGGSQPHNNVGPYLELKYIIAVVGLYPSQS